MDESQELGVLEIQLQCLSDSHTWFPDRAKDLPFVLLCLAGEVGELCNLMKKVERGSKEWNDEARVEMAMEMADVFIYLAHAATIIGINLEEAYKEKRKENVRRFTRSTTNGGSSTSGKDEQPGE